MIVPAIEGQCLRELSHRFAINGRFVHASLPFESLAGIITFGRTGAEITCRVTRQWSPQRLFWVCSCVEVRGGRFAGVILDRPLTAAASFDARANRDCHERDASVPAG